ncbi:hypothetical protein LTR05_005788 [Lithohypha guttulata]|uniref:Uncharacterized protein n=1 Tax=Lithohypha guttulata TaxID=1690604 RepID=A0AAN7SYC6_9EURO|nr:hypothetical protein LTR05_005788 [Lithohypha guttulata]
MTTGTSKRSNLQSLRENSVDDLFEGDLEPDQLLYSHDEEFDLSNRDDQSPRRTLEDELRQIYGGEYPAPAFDDYLEVKAEDEVEEQFQKSSIEKTGQHQARRTSIPPARAISGAGGDGMLFSFETHFGSHTITSKTEQYHNDIHKPQTTNVTNGKSVGSPDTQSVNSFAVNLDLDGTSPQIDRVLKQIKSKHTRQALHDADPTLTRQDLFNIYKHAVASGEEELASSKHTSRDHIGSVSTETALDDYRASKFTHATSRHSSLMHAKPYLSDPTPVEVQGHHPSTIPRSPQRCPSRTSSLASETRPILDEDEPQPLTEEALALKTSSTPKEDDTPFRLPGIAGRPESPFMRPTASASCASTGRSSPLRRHLDCVDTASTKALMGSPAPDPLQVPSRPDTPRPTVTDRYSQSFMEACGPNHLSFLSSPFVERCVSADEDINMPDPNQTSPVDDPNIYTSFDGMKSPQDSAPHFEAEGFSGSEPVTDFDNIDPDPMNPMAHGGRQDDHLPEIPHLHDEGLSVVQSYTRPRVATSSNRIPQLAPPWEEPRSTADKSNLRSHKDRGLGQHSEHGVELVLPSVPGEKPFMEPETERKSQSDPFASGADLISFAPATDSEPEPLDLLTGFVGSIHQAKRGQKKPPAKARAGQRSATAGRLPARTQENDSAASKQGGLVKMAGKRSKSTALGVQGIRVKVSKSQVTSRKVTRSVKLTTTRPTSQVPEVPDDMDVDIDLPLEELQPPPETPEQDSGLEQDEITVNSGGAQPSKKSRSARGKASRPANMTPRRSNRQRNTVSPEQMTVDSPEPQATTQTTPSRAKSRQNHNKASAADKHHVETGEKPSGDTVSRSRVPRTPRSRKKVVGDRLNPQSAAKSTEKEQPVATRRSPRIAKMMGHS